MPMKITLLLLSFAFFASTKLAADTSPTPDALLIKNVTLIDGGATTAGPVRDVLLQDGLIVKIAPLIQEDLARVIDGRGKYLSPGLIDSHTHLSGVPGMTFHDEQTFPEVAAEARRKLPLAYLYHGFTTVIDLNSGPGRMQEWNSAPFGPRGYFCGASPVMDGYPMHFMPKPLRYQITQYFIHSDADRLAEAGVVPERHTPEAAAQRIREDGGVCVKTHYEPGFGGQRQWPIPTKALIRRLTKASEAQGLPVVMHANSLEAHAFGIEAGVDAFVHGIWKTGLESDPPLLLEEVIKRAVEQNIAHQPTIQVLYGERDLLDPDYLDNPAFQAVVPDALLAWYKSEPGQATARRVLTYPGVKAIIESKGWRTLFQSSIGMATDAFAAHSKLGGRLIFGSDTPSDITYANPSGLNGRMEMDRWIKAGVTPAEIHAAATSENAAFFGLDGKIGSIAVGKNADLLLLDDNPLESVEAYDAIDVVIVRGRALKREEIASMIKD